MTIVAALLTLALLATFIIWRRIPRTQPDDFTTDMAYLARMGRQLWSQALHWDPKPAIPDLDLLCDFIPGCEIELFLAVDMAAFELIGDDIAAAFAGVRR